MPLLKALPEEENFHKNINIFITRRLVGLASSDAQSSLNHKNIFNVNEDFRHEVFKIKIRFDTRRAKQIFFQDIIINSTSKQIISFSNLMSLRCQLFRGRFLCQRILYRHSLEDATLMLLLVDS